MQQFGLRLQITMDFVFVIYLMLNKANIFNLIVVISVS